MTIHSLGHSTVRFLVIVMLLGVQFMLCGCSSPGQATGRVFGEVAIDGVPLPEGQIHFFAVGGGIGADGAIAAGKYDIPSREGMSAGKYRVELSAEKKSGKQVPDRDGGPGDMKEAVIESLPAKFNRNSKIQIDYDPKVSRPYDFKL